MTALFAKAATGPVASDGRDDFDFMIGRWAVSHRRLRRRLVGDRQWDEFGGSLEFRPLLGGQANVDDNVIDLPSGPYRAVTLRLFDPAKKLWSIWWIDGRKAVLDPPVHGRFENGVGTFLGDDVLDGRPIRVRFIWTASTARGPRWEQAFSADGGATWETNWSMNFARTG
ncbi:MAG TPA: DUF1579 domain-containing protein [Alphaproteobacteria bacterium]|nr:DUF1579 domain-containing protein [Alphaproteobacteria bacterium]